MIDAMWGNEGFSSFEQILEQTVELILQVLHDEKKKKN